MNRMVLTLVLSTACTPSRSASPAAVTQARSDAQDSRLHQPEEIRLLIVHALESILPGAALEVRHFLESPGGPPFPMWEAAFMIVASGSVQEVGGVLVEVTQRDCMSLTAELSGVLAEGVGKYDFKISPLEPDNLTVDPASLASAIRRHYSELPPGTLPAPKCCPRCGGG